MKTLITLIAAAGLAASAAFAAEKWTKPQQEVAAVFKAWAESELAMDVDREMALMAPAFTYWDFAQPAPIDRAAVRQMTIEVFKSGKVTACVIEPTQISIDGGTAIAHGRYHETLKDAAGTTTTMGGPWTAGLVQSGGKWLVLGLGFANDPPTTDKSEESALIQLENDWCKAYLARDVKALGRIEAEQWVCTSWKGEVIGRAEDMADLESGAYVAKEFKVEDLKVRLHGDTAVVTGRQTEKATYKGEDASGVFAITDTWRKQRDGSWQCIASQLTKLPPQ